MEKAYEGVVEGKYYAIVRSIVDKEKSLRLVEEERRGPLERFAGVTMAR